MKLFPATLFTFLGVMSSMASADTWKVVRESGEAWVISQNGLKTPVATGQVVPQGATLVTDSGRLQLQRNAEFIMVGPYSQMAISPSPDAGLKTTVVQSAGTLEFDVEKRHVKYFSVETPILAAVVKGTHFVVRVSDKKAQVNVRRGRVEVTELKSGKIASVVHEQNVVSSGRGFVLSGAGPFSPIVQGIPRRAVALLDTVAGTDSLLMATTPSSDSSSSPAAASASAIVQSSAPSISSASSDDGDISSAGSSQSSWSIKGSQRSSGGNSRNGGGYGNSGGHGQGNNGNGNGNGGNHGSNNGHGHGHN